MLLKVVFRRRQFFKDEQKAGFIPLLRGMRITINAKMNPASEAAMFKPTDGDEG
jgi:hypothetical protein